jgi:hypothetical protein
MIELIIIILLLKLLCSFLYFNMNSKNTLYIDMKEHSDN